MALESEGGARVVSKKVARKEKLRNSLVISRAAIVAGHSSGRLVYCFTMESSEPPTILVWNETHGTPSEDKWTFFHSLWRTSLPLRPSSHAYTRAHSRNSWPFFDITTFSTITTTNQLPSTQPPLALLPPWNPYRSTTTKLTRPFYPSIRKFRGIN